MSVKRIMLYIIAAETISLVLFWLPLPYFRASVFFLIVALFFYLSIKDIKYGLYIIFAELFIGSLGYLFWLDIGGFRISIRIALWTIFMLVWLIKESRSAIKEKKIPISFIISKQTFIKSIHFHFLILIFFIFWGIARAFFNGNDASDIFFDVNGWFFIFLFFPIYTILEKEKNNKNFFINLKDLFIASVLWVTFKSFILLYLFSHNFNNILPFIYRWVRDTRIGEITQMDGEFVRIFFQSYIFALAGAFVFLLLYVNSRKLKIDQGKYLLGASLIFAVAILSFSRSNWSGMIFGLMLLAYVFWRHFKKKNLLLPIFSLLTVFVLSLISIIVVINFPLPSSSTKGSAVDLVKERTYNISEEAGASSRWNLLPVLWDEIKKNPIAGYGYGKTLTYISDDPRVREVNPSGEYTTYAFEWGWLEIWLKLGILGLLAYVSLIIAIVKKAWPVVKNEAFLNEDNLFLAGLTAGLVCLFIINIFSPYFNHPLGIGYLLFIYLFLELKSSQITFPLAKN